jgi:hypothetical protein
MPYMFPVVREIVEPRSGRPASALGTDPIRQRELVTASLLRVPRDDHYGSSGSRRPPSA